MVLSRLTKITGPGVATDTNWVGNNADFTGITTTATSFNIGVTTIHSTLIESHNIVSTGIITATGGSFSGNVTAVDGTFSGNVSIAGTLTYEDVTNIDSVGIITAPALDVDDFLDVGSNIKLGNAGVITATSFVGSGAALTGIDATAIKDSGGNVKVQAQASGAMYTGIHTFSSDIDVDGHTNLDNVSVAGVTTFSDDVTFTGASYNVTWDKSDNALEFVDNAKIGFGNGNKATLLHSGSQLFLNNTSGNIYLRLNDENAVLARPNSAVELYHDGNLKFNTASSGINVTGVTTTTGLAVTGVSTFTGNIDANGDLDVDGHTNLDNVSIAGVVTATSFVGSGANLTGITGTTINNNANNRLITGSGTANTLEGESKLTFDASTTQLKITRDDDSNSGLYVFHNDGNECARLVQKGTGHEGTLVLRDGGTATILLDGETGSPSWLNAGSVGIGTNSPTANALTLGGTAAAVICQNPNSGYGTNQGFYFGNGNGTIGYVWNYENDQIRFATNNTERLRIRGEGPHLLLGGTSSVNDITETSSHSGLVIGNTSMGNGGLAIINSTTGAGRIYFGDSVGGNAARNRGQIVYYHSSDHMHFATAGSERLRIDSSGHMGLGVTPNTNWPTNNDFKAFQLGTGACIFGRGSGDEDRGGIAVNYYYSSGDKYLANGYGSRIYMADGNIYLQNAASNSSGAGAAMSLKTRLRVDQNGRLKINHTQTPGQLDDTWLSIYDANSDSSANDPAGISKNYAMMAFHNYGTGSTGDAAGIGFGAGASFTYTKGSIAFTRSGSYGTGDLVFLTNNDQDTTLVNDTDEKLRITREGLIQAKTLSGSYYPIASVKDGSTSARAATSAWEIKKTLGPRAKTGYYYLKNPYDSSVNTWWCDMTTDGGGWILVAHVGDGGMSDQGTGGTHWYSRSNKGGFDTVGAGYYAGGGYWRTSGGAWSENTCGQLMWDVRTHYSEFDHRSNDKVVFNWGTDQAIPSGSSALSNIPNASNRRFNDWCYAVENAPGFNPMNYDNNVRSNTINGANYFTEHMLMTWSFRNTSGNADGGSNGPYWQIGAHANGLHQHYEESISGDSYGDGSYQVISNEDTGWGGGGTNNGYRRIGREASTGTCNVWLR